MLFASAIILLLLGRLPVQRRHALDGGAHGAGTQCDMGGCRWEGERHRGDDRESRKDGESRTELEASF
jgi:hypothetical protein